MLSQLKGCSGIQWTETRSAAPPATVPGAAPHHRELSSPKWQLERPCPRPKLPPQHCSQPLSRVNLTFQPDPGAPQTVQARAWEGRGKEPAHSPPPASGCPCAPPPDPALGSPPGPPPQPHARVHKSARFLRPPRPFPGRRRRLLCEAAQPGPGGCRVPVGAPGPLPRSLLSALKRVGGWSS